MIQIALAASLVWLFFHFKEKDGMVDGFTATSFVLVPALIIFLVNAAILALGAPSWVVYALESGYFLAPFLFLKFAIDYSTAKAATYAAVVLTINVISQVLVMLLLSSPEL